MHIFLQPKSKKVLYSLQALKRLFLSKIQKNTSKKALNSNPSADMPTKKQQKPNNNLW